MPLLINNATVSGR